MSPRTCPNSGDKRTMWQVSKKGLLLQSLPLQIHSGASGRSHLLLNKEKNNPIAKENFPSKAMGFCFIKKRLLVRGYRFL